MTERPLIELRNLTKIYQEGKREHAVFRDVNTEFNKGALIVLLGRSGSGKSTLLNLISGIDEPTAGDVIINSTQITQLSEQERTLFRRRHIGFIFQFFNLIPTLTVEENLLLPIELNNRIDSEMRDKALGLLEEVGLGDRATSFPEGLSGGEQQRVAIARALVHDPLLILADEPTGNLDLETGRDVLDLLDRLTRQAGKTMIMGTHSKEVVGIADRILNIRNGQLVEDNAKS
ncbi:MAG: ABC transporter ATP-binding protein [Gammaproteobacteria bacterium]